MGENIFNLVPLAAAEKYDLVVAHGKGQSPASITKGAIDTYGGIRKFISTWRYRCHQTKYRVGQIEPEQAANTNPEVVAAVVKLCLEAGAKKVKVFDRTVNDPRRCYKQSGIADAVGPLGAELSYIDDRRFSDMSIKGQVLKSWPLYRDVFEADKIINVPIAKHHGLAKLTMAMRRGA